MLTMLNKNQL